MKEEIVISQFGGVQGGVDQRETPPGSAEYALNLDPSYRQGSFAGARLTSDYVSDQVDVIALFGDGTEALYMDGTDIRHIADFVNSPEVSTSVGTLSDVIGMSVEGLGVILYRGPGNSPYFAVDLDFAHFSAVAPSPNWQVVPASPFRPLAFDLAVTGLAASTATSATVPNDRRYEYGISYTYNLTTESPIARDIDYYSSSAYFDAVALNGYEYLDVVVGIQTSFVSTLATAVNLYRRERLFDEETTASDWEFVESESLIDGAWTPATVNGQPGYTWTYRDQGSIGASFERRTGYSETVEDMTVSYGLSAIVAGRNIVANVSTPVLEGDQSNMLIASKPFRYRVFDWLADFVTLPTKVRALVFFKGILYAMDKGRTYLIDTTGDGLVHRDTFEGIGTFSQDSAIVTDRGMFFADPGNMYMDLGNGAIPMASDILESTHDPTAGWQNARHYWDPVVFYEASTDCFGCLFNASVTGDPVTASANYIWLLHVPTKRWSLLPAPSGEIRTRLQDGDGNAYVSVGSSLIKIMGGARDGWRYISNDLSDGITEAYYYEIRWRGDTADIIVHEDQKALEPIATTGALVAPRTYKVEVNDGPPFRKVRAFQFEAACDGVIDEFTVIRRRKGAR